MKFHYLFFDNFLPEAFNCALVVLTSTMNNRKFRLGQVEWIGVVLSEMIKFIQRNRFDEFFFRRCRLLMYLRNGRR